MKLNAELMVFTTRPPIGEPLWIPQSIAKDIGAKKGDRLTADQMDTAGIEALLESRRKGVR